jgi:hypothetical protein
VFDQYEVFAQQIAGSPRISERFCSHVGYRIPPRKH